MIHPRAAQGSAADTGLALPTVAPATAAISATTASSGATTLPFGASFVDVQFAAAELATVEAGDGLFAIVVAGHLDEPETARAAGIAVGEDTDSIDLSIGRKQLPQLIFRGIEAEVADEYVLHANAPQLSYLSVGDPAAKWRWLANFRGRSWRTIKRGGSIADPSSGGNPIVCGVLITIR
jgi:hypothetical protein